MRLPVRATVTCPECGATFDATTAKFCGRCGALLDDRTSDVAAEQDTTGEDGDDAPLRRRALLSATAALGVLLAVAAVRGGLGTDGEPTGAVEVPRSAVSSLPANPSDDTSAPVAAPPTCRSASGTDCRLWWQPAPSPASSWSRAGTRVIGVDDDRAVAFDLDTGAPTWSRTFTGRVQVRGTSIDHVVLAAAGRSTIVLDSTTGDDLWTAAGYIPVFASPVLADAGIVLVARANTSSGGAPAPAGDVLALDLTDGSERWRIASDGPAAAALRMPGGGLVLDLSHSPVSGTTLIAIVPDTGETIWSIAVDGTVAGTVDDGLVVPEGPSAARGDEPAVPGALTVREIATGDVRWRIETAADGWVRGAGSHVLTGGGSSTTERPTIARSPLDGAVQWESVPLRGILPVMAGDVPTRWWAATRVPTGPLVGFDLANNVVRLDVTTGRPSWQRAVQGVWFGLATEHHVYLFRGDVGDDPGGVRVLDVADGTAVLEVAGRFDDVVSFDPLIVGGDDGVARLADPPVGTPSPNPNDAPPARAG